MTQLFKTTVKATCAFHAPAKASIPFSGGQKVLFQANTIGLPDDARGKPSLLDAGSLEGPGYGAGVFRRKPSVGR